MEDIKKIVIFGTGAVAAEITSQLEDSDWGEKVGIQIKGYVTSVKNGIENWHKYNYSSPYLGHFDDYEIQDDDYFVVAIGDNPKVKREIVTQIKQKNGKFITLIHPTAIVAKTAVIGEGNILDPFTIVGPNVHLGNFNLLTSQTIISHDCNVGDFNFFATSLLCGHTHVGNDNYFGIRATTIPYVAIGDHNIIQAGMVVDKSIGNDTTILHRFKEKVMVLSVSSKED